MTSRERPRATDIRAAQREDLRVLESGHSRRQDLIGRGRGEPAELADERRAVDGEVDRLAERNVVAEQRPARVEEEASPGKRLLDEEPGAVDAVLADQLAKPRSRDHGKEVELALLNRVDPRVRL